MLGVLFALAVSSAAPDLQLVGVVIARSPERSVVILRSAGQTRVSAVGDTAFGGRLVAVATDGATLDFGGETVRVRLVAASARPPLPAAAAALVRPGPGRPEDPATPARTMEKREVERRLGSEISRILAETALVPVMQDGHVAGLALTRIPEGTLLIDAGLRPGDVLTEVNDTRIDGMGTLIGLWPRLQNATELRALVLRNGQPVPLSLILR
jgi:type II secretion system protein C